MAQQRAADDAAAPRILVVRTGGIAGLRRQWQVEPAEDADDWLTLVAACPWDDVPVDATSRDAFIWQIETRMPTATHLARVPDRGLVGPWRELVTRVQERAADG
jgi:hypothetical protein